MKCFTVAVLFPLRWRQGEATARVCCSPGLSGHPVVLELEEQSPRFSHPRATANRSPVTMGELNSPHIRYQGVLADTQRATTGDEINLAETGETLMESLFNQLSTQPPKVVVPDIKMFKLLSLLKTLPWLPISYNTIACPWYVLQFLPAWLLPTVTSVFAVPFQTTFAPSFLTYRPFPLHGRFTWLHLHLWASAPASPLSRRQRQPTTQRGGCPTSLLLRQPR